jgi:hypothetical protein
MLMLCCLVCVLADCTRSMRWRRRPSNNSCASKEARVISHADYGQCKVAFVNKLQTISVTQCVLCAHAARSSACLITKQRAKQRDTRRDTIVDSQKPLHTQEILCQQVKRYAMQKAAALFTSLRTLCLLNSSSQYLWQQQQQCGKQQLISTTTEVVSIDVFSVYA